MNIIKRTIIFIIVSSCTVTASISSPSNKLAVAYAAQNTNNSMGHNLITNGSLPVRNNKLEAGNLFATYGTVTEAGKLAREEVYNHKTKVISYIKTKESNISTVVKKLEKVIYEESDSCDKGDFMLWHVDTSATSYGVRKAGSYYYYTIMSLYSYLLTLDQLKELDTRVNSIMSGFHFTSSTTEYNKIKTIYDYICTHVKYSNDSTMIKYTAYAAAINGKAVCQGYATLFYMMCKKAGLGVRVIPGIAEQSGEQHGWNIVKIGNLYYNVDATWDAANYEKEKKYICFLKGDKFSLHTRWDDYATAEFYLSYPMAKNAYGTGNATISNNTAKSKFTLIKPKFKKVTRKKAVFKKVSSAKGYQIKYSTKKNFGAKYTKTKRTKKLTYKFKKLKKKKYFTKFRAYTTMSGKKIYTKWSKIKKIKKS